MPQTDVVFFAEDDGSAPLLAWLDGLAAKAQNKRIVRIERLAELGHELRRPGADLLRDGIYELRARHGTVWYRMLYFFRGGRAVLSHGCTKEETVPPAEIDRALRNRARCEQDPQKNTYEE